MLVNQSIFLAALTILFSFTLTITSRARVRTLSGTELVGDVSPYDLETSSRRPPPAHALALRSPNPQKTHCIAPCCSKALVAHGFLEAIDCWQQCVDEQQRPHRASFGSGTLA